MRILISIAIPVICAMLLSCGGSSEKNEGGMPKDAKEIIRIDVPVFNQDSAYMFIDRQLAFGPRVPGTVAHARCGAWLEEKLRTYGAEVIVQKERMRVYSGEVFMGMNIIGVINPEANARILLCSHWDSRPFADNDPDPANHRKPVDAANDGASGVGVLLEIARILQANPPSVGVDIVFFDLEDYGAPQFDENNYPDEVWGLGSQYWAKNPHVMNYKARYGILLDMVGVPNARFAHEGFSKYYAPDILKKVWSTAARLGYDKYFVNEEGGTVNDDHLYVNRYIGIPTINIIHHDRGTPTGFFKYWHTVQDNMDHIDKAVLNAVGQTVLTVIFEEGMPL